MTANAGNPFGDESRGRPFGDESRGRPFGDESADSSLNDESGGGPFDAEPFDAEPVEAASQPAAADPASSANSLVPNPGIPPIHRPAAPALPVQPPLGIIHILVWMTVCGVLLTVVSLLNWNSPERSDAFQIFQKCSNAAFSIVYATSVASLGLPLVRLINRGPRFPVHPGHWLLIVTGLVVTLNWGSFALLRLWEAWTVSSAGFELGPYSVTRVVVHFCSTIAYLVAAIGTVGRWWWRTWFLSESMLASALLLLFSIMSLLNTSAGSGLWPMSVAQTVTQAGLLLLSLSLVGLIVVDQVTGAPRDWLHWVGVVTYLAGALLNAIWIIGTPYLL